MGWLDRKVAEWEKEAHERAAEEWARGVAPHLPEGAELPYVERFRGSAFDAARGEHTVAAYIAIVGVRPEDSYGFFPRFGQQTNLTFPMVFAYRDRPEYEEGRRRFAEAFGVRLRELP